MEVIAVMLHLQNCPLIAKYMNIWIAMNSLQHCMTLPNYHHAAIALHLTPGARFPMLDIVESRTWRLMLWLVSAFARNNLITYASLLFMYEGSDWINRYSWETADCITYRCNRERRLSPAYFSTDSPDWSAVWGPFQTPSRWRHWYFRRGGFSDYIHPRVSRTDLARDGTHRCWRHLWW